MQRVWGKTMFGGAHPQRFNALQAYGCTRLERGGDPRAVGLRRTCASGKLVKVHFSPRVADFV